MTFNTVQLARVNYYVRFFPRHSKLYTSVYINLLLWWSIDLYIICYVMNSTTQKSKLARANWRYVIFFFFFFLPFSGKLPVAYTRSDCPRNSDASVRRSRDSILCESLSHGRSAGINVLVKLFKSKDRENFLND